MCVTVFMFRWQRGRHDYTVLERPVSTGTDISGGESPERCDYRGGISYFFSHSDQSLFCEREHHTFRSVMLTDMLRHCAALAFYVSLSIVLLIILPP